MYCFIKIHKGKYNEAVYCFIKIHKGKYNEAVYCFIKIPKGKYNEAMYCFIKIPKGKYNEAVYCFIKIPKGKYNEAVYCFIKIPKGKYNEAMYCFIKIPKDKYNEAVYCFIKIPKGKYNEAMYCFIKIPKGKYNGHDSLTDYIFYPWYHITPDILVPQIKIDTNKEANIFSLNSEVKEYRAGGNDLSGIRRSSFISTSVSTLIKRQFFFLQTGLVAERCANEQPTLCCGCQRIISQMKWDSNVQKYDELNQY